MSSEIVLHADFETFSASDLRELGVHRYAEDPTTWIWMMSWYLGTTAAFNGRVERWHPHEQLPDAVLNHIANGGRVVAHNAAFEREIWNSVVCAVFAHFPPMLIRQMDCTMSRALALHLPGSLDDLAVVLGLKDRKDEDGYSLMLKMSRPRVRHKDGTFTWWDQPENVERLGRYCDQDVRTEVAADKVLVPLSDLERESWEIDQEINDRGAYVDAEMIQRILLVLEETKERANIRMNDITQGAVEKVTAVLPLKNWLNARGLDCDSIGKGEHDRLIDIAKLLGDDRAVAAIKLRAEAGKTSTAKFERMMEGRCVDGRLKGLFGWHRASTGRWGGQRAQPQNMVRVDEERDLPDVLGALELLEQLL